MRYGVGVIFRIREEDYLVSDLFRWSSLWFASANQSNVMGQSKQVEDGRED